VTTRFNTIWLRNAASCTLEKKRKKKSCVAEKKQKRHSYEPMRVYTDEVYQNAVFDQGRVRKVSLL